MRVRRLDGPGEFLEAAGPFLEEDEARNNLPLGIVRTCLDLPERYPGPNLFAVVEDGARVVGVAIRTPPHPLQYYAPASAAGVVAAELSSRDPDLPGVGGPAVESDAFAAAWSGLRGRVARKGKDLRAFRLDSVIPAPPVPGAMRRAEDSNLPLVSAWHRAFEEEAVHRAVGSPSDDVLLRGIRSGRMFLWDEGGRFVALAGISGTTPHGARVGPVYTPPEFRRRGYAMALVAALSSRLLAEGRRFCFLFTDLANPTSNSIYPKVGYRPVGDYREWEFAP